MTEALAPPYPADTRAKGVKPDLDRIKAAGLNRAEVSARLLAAHAQRERDEIDAHLARDVESSR